MATYISAADGNFTAAGSWAQVETGTGAVQATIGFNVATGTSYQYSNAFTGTNGNVCDGIMLYCQRVNTTGTVTVALSDDNGTTATREVTINASDLPSTLSWVFFKFASTLTLDGGTDYKVGFKGSSAGNANFSRDASSGVNFSRYLRITTNAASVAAADIFFIVGEYTAAATYTARTITMDSTANTDYGAISVCPQGTLQYGTSASTNYLLRTSGTLNVYENGTFNIGTSGTPIPRTSTAVLEFDCTTAAEFGLIVTGSFNCYGQSRTSGKDIYYCKLNANASAGATSLTVDTDTGWLNGDTIALAPTTRTYTQSESRTLSADATATTLTISSGLTNARDGVSPTQAEIINLTRNVRIRSTGSAAANATYVRAAATSTVNIYWTELYYLGSNSTTTSGITVQTTTGTFNMYYCSVHDMFYYMNISSTSGSGITVRYNGFYNTGTASPTYCVQIAATSGVNTFSDNIIIYAIASTAALNIADIGGNIDNNVVAASSLYGFYLNQASAVGSFSGNTAHSCNAPGVIIVNSPIGSIGPITIWRCNDYGINVTSNAATSYTINNLTAFGNVTTNLNINNTPNLTVEGFTSYSETSYSTSYGVIAQSASIANVAFINCDISASGKTAHTADIQINGPAYVNYSLNNCRLGAASEVTSRSNMTTNSKITSSKHDQTTGAYKYFKTAGTGERDSTTYKTAAPSEKMTPISATTKFPSGSRLAAVDNTKTLTVSVWIRKSAAGDGAAYNGNQPRLIVKRNDAIGITADTVLATYTAGTGSWNQISGTTAAVTDDGALEFYVDCDGTAGWINVDDWTVTQS